MPIEAGKAAPAFTLHDSEGNKVSLKDFKGKNVIIYFYPKDDTPGCTREACGFRDAHAQIEKHDAVVLGVSPDDVASHQAFARKYALPFTLLSDPTHRMLQRYDAWGEKNLYGKKSMGVIRSTVWVGPDGKVVKHWRSVARTETHPAQVLAALKANAHA